MKRWSVIIPHPRLQHQSPVPAPTSPYQPFWLQAMLSKFSSGYALEDGSKFLTASSLSQLVRGLPDGAGRLYPLDPHALLSLARGALERSHIERPSVTLRPSRSGRIPQDPLTWPHVVETMLVPLTRLMDECCEADGWSHERKKKRMRYGTRQQRSAYDELNALWPAVAPSIAAMLEEGGFSTQDLTPISTTSCLDLVAESCAATAGVVVDEHLLRDIVAPIVPHVVEPSPLLAKALVRCNLMHNVIGNALSVQLRQHAYSSLFRVELSSAMDATVPAQLVLAELIDAKREIAHLKKGSGDKATIVEEAGVNQLTRERVSRDTYRRKSLDIATETVQFALDCRTFFSRAPYTIAEAEKLMNAIRGDQPPPSDALERLVSSTTMGRHAVLLDDVLDSVLRDEISKLRGSSYHGFAFASDESPPSGSRFSGFRFQITQIYIPWFEDVSRWSLPEFDQKYPFRLSRHMCDICHAPGKTGADTLEVVDKQLTRVGLHRVEAAAGCGDGGGENEGSQGVHSILEEEHGHPQSRRRSPTVACKPMGPWGVRFITKNCGGKRGTGEGGALLGPASSPGQLSLRCLWFSALAARCISFGGCNLVGWPLPFLWNRSPLTSPPPALPKAGRTRPPPTSPPSFLEHFRAP